MMARKSSSGQKQENKQLVLEAEPGESEAQAIARTVLRPCVQAAVTLKTFGEKFGDLDLQGLIRMLSDQTLAVHEKNLGRGESMLVAQAHTLDAIFNNLAQRAAANAGKGYLAATDTYLKMALRAQSQCRATWEAVSAIQNPPVAGYVQQANIAHGPQQVNNAPADPGQSSRARKTRKQQNKLLEEKDGQRLDTRTTRAASQKDSAVAAVGEIDGAPNAGGEG